MCICNAKYAEEKNSRKKFWRLLIKRKAFIDILEMSVDDAIEFLR